MGGVQRFAIEKKVVRLCATIAACFYIMSSRNSVRYIAVLAITMCELVGRQGGSDILHLCGIMMTAYSTQHSSEYKRPR